MINDLKVIFIINSNTSLSSPYLMNINVHAVLSRNLILIIIGLIFTYSSHINESIIEYIEIKKENIFT